MNPGDLTPSSTAAAPVAPSTTTEFQSRPVDEVKKVSFWVSQLFILLATVMGVYLASSQGFKQAMMYGNLQSARNNYYLRKSLRSEIADNLPLIREYLKGLETGGLPARKAGFALDTFVWDSMKNSPSTMETPPQLLQESRKFYRGIDELQRKIADNTFGVKVGTDRITALVDHMEKQVLPFFDADSAKTEKYLRDNGMAVE